MSEVDIRSQTLREIVDAKINKCRREIADSLIPTEADMLMARIMALQDNEEGYMNE